MGTSAERAEPTVGAAGPAVAVTGVTHRNADVHPGDLFAALPGARAHGADFAGPALAAGAAAVLTDPAGLTRPELAEAVERGAVRALLHPHPRTVLGALSAAVYGDPTADLTVLGVTGTSGKTTVAHFLEAGLRAGGRATGLLGTVQTRIGTESLPSAFTTPEAPDLQALFGVMRERGVTDVAMEVSSHALAMGRVAGTRFAVGAFTNLSQDHLDFHHDMEEYFAAKARLFVDDELRAARGVVCVDDEWGRRLAGMAADAVTVSTTAPADWTARDVVTDPDGAQQAVVVAPDGQEVPLRLQLPGAFNIANAVLALAVLDLAGVPAAVAAPRFAELAVPGRMQRVEAGQGFLAVVDYAHKPAAVAALLDALRAQQPQGRIVTVLGCGGDRDTGKRPLMGAAAAARSDVLIVTDDNPRTEDPAEIRAAMRAGAEAEPARGDILEIGDRRAAIAAAVEVAKPGDVVVVAGKGHETGQEVHGVKHPFDDVDELAAAIRAAGR
ncbi:UDP-N-acetylmuramoyl-L-alanyl-D-glutamate--2,6-diaminopimelate ligase [Pseudonocardia kujensis]|uniref:UDP-N-acetylmuramoyl-L-alanyl-D-glutamate--2, 6-diaminopimelate ligase n=1 Tax=Pseudonocardia kujensis TaxID=1128675 RepID=UPI001E3004E8|nr:UDP-N-acetylmuramoyl-L-alanyl-D-glutamate--2,6-diaminopimelate ligase [Pseudonocardia kujensis]MCE0768606.1 UDP-N-acetylmuramoyl-L-alanyl-D-glutamate--2,6-diaminopimelate ligase [Pseudonocardia kujensis]